LLTQINLGHRHEPEIMIGLCVGMELDLRNRPWFETAERNPRQRMRLPARGQLMAQERKQDFLTPYAPAVLTLRWPHAAISLG
jgi:hypothetical protein